MDFDKHIKELFEAYSEQPSVDCWDKLLTHLDTLPTTPDAGSSSAASSSNASGISQFVGSVAGKITVAITSAAVIGGLAYMIFVNDSEVIENDEQHAVIAENSTDFIPQEVQDTTYFPSETYSQEQISENTVVLQAIPKDTGKAISQVSTENSNSISENSSSVVSTPIVSSPQNQNVATHETPKKSNPTEKPQNKEDNTAQTNQTQKEEPKQLSPSNDILQETETAKELPKGVDVKLAISSFMSPNGDGINDFFMIENVEQYFPNKLVVYRRDGIVIFERNNYQNDWNAENIPDGVYYYIFNFAHQEQSLMRKGSITIKR